MFQLVGTAKTVESSPRREFCDNLSQRFKKDTNLKKPSNVQGWYDEGNTIQSKVTAVYQQ